MKKNILLVSCLLLCFLTQAQEIEINPEWQNKGDFVFASYIGLTTSTLSAGDFIDEDLLSPQYGTLVRTGDGICI